MSGEESATTNISVRHEHDLEPEELRANLEKLAVKLSERLGGSWSWEGKAIVCESRGAKARVIYDESSIEVNVTLPHALRLVRGRLEAKIEEYVERYFRRS